MSEKPVGARAVVYDADKALAALRSLETGFKQLTQSIQAGATQQQDAARRAQDLDKALRDMKSGMETVGRQALVAGGALTALAGSWMMAAARAEELQIAMYQVGLNTGVTRNELDSYEAKLNESGISILKSREFLMRLMQANVDVSESTHLARTAQDLAVIGMMDSSETAVLLTQVLGSLNVRQLKQLGITTTITESLRAYGATLGLTGSELKAFVAHADSQTKRMAILNTIYAEGEKVAGVYTEAMTSASKQLRSMPRDVSDLSVEMGQTLIPILYDVVVKIRDAIKWFQGLSDTTKEIIAKTVLFSGVFLSASGVIMLFIPRIMNLVKGLKMLASGLSTLATAGIPALIGLITDVGAAFALLVGGASAAEVATLGLAGKLAVMAPIALAAASAYAAYRAVVAFTNTVNEEAANIHTKMISHMEAYATGAENATDVAREYAAAQDRGRKAVEAYIPKGLGQKKAIDALNISTGQLSRLLFESSTSYDDYSRAAEAAGIASHALTREQYELSRQEGVMIGQAQMMMRTVWEQADAMMRAQVLNQEAIEGTAVSFEVLEEAIDASVQAWGRMDWDSQALWQMAQASGASEGELRKLALSLGIASEEEIDMAERAYQLMAAFGSGAISAEELALALHDLKLEALALEGATQGVTIAETYLEKEGLRVAANLREAKAKLVEAERNYAEEAESAAGAAISAGQRVADAQRQWEKERVRAAERAGLNIRIWEREQNEWIHDNQEKLGEDLVKEYEARTKAAIEEANKVAQYDAKLAEDLLSAEAKYQKDKARLIEEGNEEGLAMLERDYAEQIEDLKAHAELERKYREEDRKEQIAAMREGGRQAGLAMAETLLEEMKKGYDKAKAEADIHARHVHLSLSEDLYDGARKGAQNLASDLRDATQEVDDLGTSLAAVSDAEWVINVRIETEKSHEWDTMSPKFRFQYNLETLQAWLYANPLRVQVGTEGEYGRTAFDILGAFGGLGGEAASRLKTNVIDPLDAQIAYFDETIKRFRESMAEEPLTSWEYYKRVEGLYSLERQRNDLLAQRAALEGKVAQYQQQQQDLAFLEKQMDLLRLIEEEGLDRIEILGGMKLGLEASEEDILDAMSRAMQAIIAQVNADLQIASPSKKFIEVGKQTGLGVAFGIRESMEDVMLAMRDVVSTMELETQRQRMPFSPGVGGGVQSHVVVVEKDARVFNTSYRTGEPRTSTGSLVDDYLLKELT